MVDQVIVLNAQNIISLYNFLNKFIVISKIGKIGTLFEQINNLKKSGKNKLLIFH